MRKRRRRGVNWESKKLRDNRTLAERHLWSRLSKRQLGYTFVRHWAIGRYTATFACRTAKFAIEVDGSRPISQDIDVARDMAAKRDGFRIICFWEIDVLAKVGQVITIILEELQNRSQNSGIHWPEI